MSSIQLPTYNRPPLTLISEEEQKERESQYNWELHNIATQLIYRLVEVIECPEKESAEKALEAYQKRADMGGWEEEIWFSLFRVAIIRGIKGDTWPVIKE